ncbi:WbqC family protein [Paenibacillus polymyxa]|uniref:WbqC family protein n=1 Tax=Paenibacillus polymyxa TaxID=1406 RepID=UPI0006760009|nr:WbqC family protein [Paenibacillus polymyxa]
MNTTLLSIHQPNFMPWIGLINKIVISDIFVILDDVYFSKSQFQNRNSVLTANGTVYLSVPVKKKAHEFINKVEISYDTNWRKKHLETLYFSYKKCNQFRPFFERLEGIYQKDYKFLIDLNIEIIKNIFDYLDINFKIILSSELQVGLGKTTRIIEICKKIYSNIYIYGGDSNYLDRSQFEEKRIKLIPQNFIHPIYYQKHSHEFVKNLSIVDWIFQASKQEIRSYLLNQKERFAIELKKQLSLV